MKDYKLEMVYLLWKVEPSSVSRIGGPYGNQPCCVAVISTKELALEYAKAHLVTVRHKRVPIDRSMTVENNFVVEGSPKNYKQRSCTDFGGYLLENLGGDCQGDQVYVLYQVEQSIDPGCGCFYYAIDVKVNKNDLQIPKIEILRPIHDEMTTENEFCLDGRPAVLIDWEDCHVPVGGFIIENLPLVRTKEDLQQGIAKEMRYSCGL